MTDIGPTVGMLQRMAGNAHLATIGPITGVGITDFVLPDPMRMAELSMQLTLDARATVERREVGVIERLKRMALGEDSLTP